MCGIGTTLVEAMHLGRMAVGIKYEPRWAEVAEGNLALAEAFGATGTGEVHAGDARSLGSLVPASIRGRVALVLTSPPYGSSVHGRVDVRSGAVLKRDDRYSRDASNLAHVGEAELLHAVGTSSRHVFRCSGRAGSRWSRPGRGAKGLLVDFPGAVLGAAEAAGLSRCSAWWLCWLRSTKTGSCLGRRSSSSAWCAKPGPTASRCGSSPTRTSSSSGSGEREWWAGREGGGGRVGVGEEEKGQKRGKREREGGGRGKGGEGKKGGGGGRRGGGGEGEERGKREEGEGGGRGERKGEEKGGRRGKEGGGGGEGEEGEEKRERRRRGEGKGGGEGGGGGRGEGGGGGGEEEEGGKR